MIEELKFELELALQQLEIAADWAPSRCTTGVIKLQCQEARKVLAKLDAKVAEDETAALMQRLRKPAL